MNGKAQYLLRVVVEEYRKTKAPVPRNKIWRDLMPDAYMKHNGCGMCDDIRQLSGLKMITYTPRSNNKNLDPIYRNTSSITPTSKGIEYIMNTKSTDKNTEPEIIRAKPPVLDRLAHTLHEAQQAREIAQEISRRDLDTKNQEIATLKTINAEQAEEIKSLKRKLAKLAAVVSVDDLLSMI